MRKLSTVLSSLQANKARWRSLLRPLQTSAPFTRESHIPNRLREVASFGSNPGNLRMFDFAPSRKSRRPALVVALHGCTQSAAAHDHGTGWSKLADRHGFVVLAPQQQQSNNPNTCFTWFQPGDTARGHGEAMSIRQMIDRAVVEHGVDPARVFVTGLSAGGAMASVMLASYPETFAAGAIVAGLPFGAAANLEQAFDSMFTGPRFSGDEFAALVRRASSHDGPWPRVSVWHGANDRTVKPENANAIVAQWTTLHALPATPTAVSNTSAYRHRVWANARGETLVEEYLVAGMGHAVPLATADPDAIGMPGPYFVEAGISSTEHIAAFWGIAEVPLEEVSPARHQPATAEEVLEPVRWPGSSSAAAGREGAVADVEVLARPEPLAEPADDRRPASHSVDVGAVIKNALRSAGLMR